MSEPPRRISSEMPVLAPGTRVCFHHGKWNRALYSEGLYEYDPDWRNPATYFYREGTVLGPVVQTRPPKTFPTPG